MRALARDLGAALGVGGHLTALRRTRVGPFTLAHARTLEALGTRRRCRSRWTRPWRWRSRAGTPTRGRPPTSRTAARCRPAGVEGIQGVFAPDGHVLALVRDRDGRARPVVVLAPA